MEQEPLDLQLEPVPAAAPMSTTAILELLQKDPTLWQHNETMEMIAYFRTQRSRFAEAKAMEAAGGKKVRTKNPAKALAAPIEGLTLDLDIA